MTLQAVWNGNVLAESDKTRVVEGNHYFPPDSLRHEYFTKTRMKTLCYWKGLASYYTVTAAGSSNPYAAWYYPRPSPLARKIKNHVAFGNGVQIVKTSE